MTYPPVRRVVAVAALCAAMSGCGRYYWSKSDAVLEDFNRDSAACAKEASPAYGIVIEDGYRRCLTNRGWMRARQLDPPPSNWYRGIE
jgi:type IV pilus biogenesis protein CpaD/CtpE